MKTYRNEQHSLAVKIPDEWSFHSTGKDGSLIFKCRSNEAFHIHIGSWKPKSDLEQTEHEFEREAQNKGYTALSLGRVTVGGKEHVWARYYIWGGLWSKKYMIVLNEIEYAITATCREEKLLLEMEKGWDAVVASFGITDEQAETESGIHTPRSEVLVKSTAEEAGVVREILSKEKPAGVKTYRNEEQGFAIDVPEAWILPTDNPYRSFFDQSIIFGCGAQEAFNLQIGPLLPEPTLDLMQRKFSGYAQHNKYTDLTFGRVSIEGKQHLWARYCVGRGGWAKKYLLVLGGTEYAITATCFDPGMVAEKEKVWDEIVRSFHLSQPKKQEIQDIKDYRRDTAGTLYEKAYEAVAHENDSEARHLLEQCLHENPDHILAHKELAVILKKEGDLHGALFHREEVKRLDPSDKINRYNLSFLFAWLGQKEAALQEAEGLLALEPHNPSFQTLVNTMAGEKAPENRRAASQTASRKKIKQEASEQKRQSTLLFSINSYVLIILLSAAYIHFKIGFEVLFSLNNESYQPLTSFEFNAAVFIMIVGIGASICLLFLLGVAAPRQDPDTASTFWGFLARTMQIRDRKNEKLGALIFSEYTRKSNGSVDAFSLQTLSFLHSLFKIFMIPFSVGQLNFVLMSLFAVLLILQTVLKYPTPVSWIAIYWMFFYYFCYRAFLFFSAKLRGISRDGDIARPVELVASSSLAPSIRTTMTREIMPRSIGEVLNQEYIVNAIKSDLRKTDQVGYREMWRLGLITPDQDWYDPRLDPGSLQERTNRYLHDKNYRFKWMEQIPVKRTAVLHSRSYFNAQFNNVLVTNGVRRQHLYYGGSYPLGTTLEIGESICIRDIRINTSSPSAQGRSESLARFLREDGFPLKETYPDGDPLTTERGGVIVLTKEGLLLTYPKYLAQRRLIDDEGNLVDLGIDEGFSLGGVIEVKMRPAVLDSLVRYVAVNGYTPVLRYHSIPYASDFMIPILDAPISISGWADLFIDTRGKGKLFITRDKTKSEWYEMMARLRQLFYDELARTEYHLLGLAKDKAHLNYYLSRKMDILKDYYIIQDWNLP